MSWWGLWWGPPAPTFWDHCSVDNDWEDSDDYEDREDDGDNRSNLTDEHNPSLNSFKKMSHVVMFPETQLSTCHVSLMVIAYSILYHSKYEARDSLFDMCKIFAVEKFHDWNTSKHVMNQLYDPPDGMINLCFLCTKCCEPLLPPVLK